MDKLKEILEEHSSLYSGDDCTCVPRVYEGGWDFNEHLAEKLRPLLAEVYAEGFRAAEYESDGFTSVSGWTNRNPYATKETN